MQIPVKFFKVLNPPAEPAVANAFYLIAGEEDEVVDVRITDQDGYVKATGNAAFVLSVMSAAMALKAPLASPELTGEPTAPTPEDPESDSQQIANVEFVYAVRDAVLNAAPEQLNTLQELAAALGDDEDFANTMTAALAAKEATANKDAENGYVGISAWKIKFRNLANTFTSFFQNSNTAARTYTFQDRNGTIADDTDIAGRQPLDADLTAIAALTTNAFGRSLLEAASAAAAKTLLEITGGEEPIPLSYLDTDGTLAANSDTKVASQKAVNTKIAAAVANLINSAPGALDTLDELAAAMGDDANFATTVTNALALKAPLASPALTGTPTAPTAAAATNTTQIATTAHVFAERSNTATLTNKRVTKRVLALSANSATPAINTDDYDVVKITGQTAAITSMTTNLTGTPTDGQTLWISFTAASGTPAITWGASFEDSTITAPTAMSTTRIDVGYIWNAATSKWRCVGKA